MKSFCFALLFLWTAGAGADLVDFQPLHVRAMSFYNRIPSRAKFTVHFENSKISLTGADLAHVIDIMAHNEWAELSEFGLSEKSVPSVIEMINAWNLAHRAGRERKLQPLAENLLDMTLLSSTHDQFEPWLTKNVWAPKRFPLSYSTKRAVRSFLTSYAWALLLDADFNGEQLDSAVYNASQGLRWLNYKIQKEKKIEPREKIAFFEKLFVAIFEHTEPGQIQIFQEIVHQAHLGQNRARWLFYGWLSAVVGTTTVTAFFPDIYGFDPSLLLSLSVVASSYKLMQAHQKGESVEPVKSGNENAKAQCYPLFSTAKATD